jgi:3-oxoacyl-[acyl-carrier protein] reductase
MSEFAGRVAMVTGAGSGIGEATARLFAAAGARVIVQDIDPERVATTVAAIKQAGGEAVGAAYSVADEDSLRRIVNIASNRGQVGFERSSHYAAAKAAVIGFAKSWAREFAPHGILVNALAPGVVRSGMTLRYGQEALDEEAQLNLVKRWAEPDEIAGWILFITGPRGGFMTGQLVCPNGGDPIVGI